MAATPPPTQDARVRPASTARSATAGAPRSWAGLERPRDEPVATAVGGGTGNHILTTAGTTARRCCRRSTPPTSTCAPTLAWSRTASQGTLYGTALVRRQANGSDYRAEGRRRRIRRHATGARPKGGHHRDRPANRERHRTSLRRRITQYRIAFRATASGGHRRPCRRSCGGTARPSRRMDGDGDRHDRRLQGGGSVGLNSYMSSSAAAAVTMRVDDFAGGRPGLTLTACTPSPSVIGPRADPGGGMPRAGAQRAQRHPATAGRMRRTPGEGGSPGVRASAGGRTVRRSRAAP